MSVHLNNKKRFYKLLGCLAASKPNALEEILLNIYKKKSRWRGSHPFNEIEGIDEIKEKVWLPLINSFPDLERRDSLILGGSWQGINYVGMIGHYCGTFYQDWLGIPRTGKTIYLRYGEFHEIQGDKIVESTVLIDILDVIRQAGFWPLSPSLGTEMMWPAPITGDGIIVYETTPEESAKSLQLTLNMHASINNYQDNKENSTREGFINMSQKKYWHPKMMWYGPCGIGTTRGLQGFVDYHQVPFRIAFPNRKAAGHYVCIGDGKYSATSGWPSVKGKHLGDNWLGLPATGKDIDMRVMDFYLTHEGLIRENWVPIDIIHILLQMGVDVMARMDCFFNPSKYL